MDKNTKQIVASNLTIAYMCGNSPTPHNPNSPAFLSSKPSVKSTFSVYQEFIDFLKEQEPKD